MARDFDVEDYIFSATHFDDFVVYDQGLPCAVRVLVVGIAHERGNTPGYVFVVAFNDQREAGNGDARSVEAGGAEISHIPDVGHHEAQVHIV